LKMKMHVRACPSIVLSSIDAELSSVKCPRASTLEAASVVLPCRRFYVFRLGPFSTTHMNFSIWLSKNPPWTYNSRPSSRRAHSRSAPRKSIEDRAITHCTHALTLAEIANAALYTDDRNCKRICRVRLILRNDY